MRLRSKQQRRRGTILPLVVLGLVGMCGFVALAIDIGQIAVAKAQCQNCADASALAGARSLDGTIGQNLSGAQANAANLAETNLVLTQVPTASFRWGAFHYDTKNQLFVPTFPPVSPDNYNMCEATVTYNVNTSFAPVFKLIQGSFNPVVSVTAVSQAAHRPRDIAIVLDFSGSMNNQSDLWNNEAYLDNGQAAPDNPNFTSNNTETVYPLFGHYSAANNYSDYAHGPNLLCPASIPGNPLYNNALIGWSNVSQPVSGTAAMVGDFYSNTRGSNPASAFISYPDSYATTPLGDNYPFKNKNTVLATYSPGSSYATNVNDILGNTTTSKDTNWETYGYGYTAITGKASSSTAFNGYTIGPRYWGETFFVWPPDPNNDWRKKFFFKPDGVTPCNDNTLLWDANGNWKDPAGNYVINYKAILAWINANIEGANPVFPEILRSGGVLLYSDSGFPTDVPATAYDHTQLNYLISNPDQRFWKEYIDWALGVWRDPAGNIQHPQTPSCSIGPDYTFGTIQISAPPSGTSPAYMNYGDNPKRPRHRMWFGPMTMIQFMMDCGYLPGTTHDISMFSMKQGVGGALTDIQNNHPNDLVAMLPFARPQYANDNPSSGMFNNPQFNLTNDYASMISSIWLPPGLPNIDDRIWTSSGNLTGLPSAHGDYDANTASSYGFMLAYNQLSSSTTLQSAGVGGFGRKGAGRLIIYETDGMANEDSIAVNGFNGTGGPYNSYYRITPSDTVNGAGYSQNNLLQVVEAICNKYDGTPYASLPSGYPTPPNYPGYATPNKPVIVQCIAFGAIFEASNSIQTSSVSLLQMISTIGQTSFPSSPTDPANGWKWCIGSLSQRQDKLKTAFLKILDSDVPVSLIK
jgi:Flp pilus assembly protein TadG